MFWSNSDGRSKSYIELVRKNIFIAEFEGIGFTSGGDNGTNFPGIGDLEKNLKLFVKKIDGPSLNLNFERGLASNKVHYFQQGEINWEPITATFVSAVDSTGAAVPRWTKLFKQYLDGSFIGNENRTTVVDLPIFCSRIIVTEYQSLANLAAPLASQFQIVSPRISKITFGSYDYSSEEANDVTVTFIPEWCEFADSSETVTNI